MAWYVYPLFALNFSTFSEFYICLSHDDITFGYESAISSVSGNYEMKVAGFKPVVMGFCQVDA